MRIFVGPNEVAGQYRNLAIALNMAGVGCDYYVFDEDSLRYGGDIGASRFPSLIRRLSSFRRERGCFCRTFISVLIETLAFIFLLKCIARYDAFLFGFGGSFLRRNMDLPLLRFFGKTIVANLSHGSDMTPPYIDGALLDAHMRMPGLDVLLARACVMKDRIERFERYADFIIGSPISSSFYSKKKYINIFHVGRVNQGLRYAEGQTVSISGELERPLGERRLRILHAPSHAAGKGTILIRKIIENLIAEGCPIDFLEISGKTNDDVIKALQRCDLVVDQVYADLPMSGLAAEAACFGKPTLIAGYELSKLRDISPPGCFPPSIVCDPEEMASTLSYLLDNPKEMISAGIAAQNFVREEWREDKVAARYLALLTRQEIPESWWHDPASAIFIHGYGLSESMSKKMVSEIVKTHGEHGLGVGHRPDLVQAFLEYSKFSD